MEPIFSNDALLHPINWTVYAYYAQVGDLDFKKLSVTDLQRLELEPETERQFSRYLHGAIEAGRVDLATQLMDLKFKGAKRLGCIVWTVNNDQEMDEEESARAEIEMSESEEAGEPPFFRYFTFVDSVLQDWNDGCAWHPFEYVLDNKMPDMLKFLQDRFSKTLYTEVPYRVRKYIPEDADTNVLRVYQDPEDL